MKTENVNWDIDTRIIKEIDRVRKQFHSEISRELIVQFILVGSMKTINIEKQDNTNV